MYSPNVGGAFKPFGPLPTLVVAFAFSEVAMSGALDLTTLLIPGEEGLALAVSGLVGIGALVATLSSAVLFLVWFHQAARNVRAFGREGLEYTPGWCVGWWFVPIASLFKPFRAVSEVYRASAPSDNPRAWLVSPSPQYLRGWWGCFIVSNLIARVAAKLDGTSAGIVGLIGTAISIGAAFGLARLVREITEVQTQSASMMVHGAPAGAPPGYAGMPATSPVGAGYNPYAPPGNR